MKGTTPVPRVTMLRTSLEGHYILLQHGALPLILYGIRTSIKIVFFKCSHFLETFSSIPYVISLTIFRFFYADDFTLFFMAHEHFRSMIWVFFTQGCSPDLVLYKVSRGVYGAVPLWVKRTLREMAVAWTDWVIKCQH